MAFPKNPDSIIIEADNYNLIKNVTEYHVWQYYDAIKQKMLPFLKDNDLMIRLKANKGSIVLRHPYNKKSEFIRINNAKDFDSYNTGRIVEYYITSPKKANMFVLDLDPGKDLKWGDIKRRTKQLYGYLKILGILKDIKIYYTGKRGFHLWCYLTKKQDVAKIREEWQKRLTAEFKDNKYYVVNKRNPKSKDFNIDLSIIKENGAWVAPFSMRMDTGFSCVNVALDDLNKLKKRDTVFSKTYEKELSKKFSWEYKEAAFRIASSFLQPLVSTPPYRGDQIQWKLNVDKYPKKEMDLGVEVEKEHKDTIEQIIFDVKNNQIKPFEYYFKEISKDHLDELKDYYTRLVKMENSAKYSNLEQYFVTDKATIQDAEGSHRMWVLTNTPKKFFDTLDRNEKEFIEDARENPSDYNYSDLNSLLKDFLDKMKWVRVNSVYKAGPVIELGSNGMSEKQLYFLQEYLDGKKIDIDWNGKYYKMPMDDFKSLNKVLDIKRHVNSAYRKKELVKGYEGKFVIHDHKAQNHHWDLRLEFPTTSLKDSLNPQYNIINEVNKNKDKAGKVLRSWAIPKHEIPVDDNLLAKETFDHEMSYGDFEGHLTGYGEGDVFIYDEGTFEILDVEYDKKYVIKFKGNKLKGIYALIKTKGKNFLWIKVKNTEKYASVIDYALPSLNEGLWRTEDGQPHLKDSFSDKIIIKLHRAFDRLGMKGAKKFIKEIYVSGSMVTNLYSALSNLDVNVVIDYDVFKEKNKNVSKRDKYLRDYIREQLYPLVDGDLLDTIKVKYFLSGEDDALIGDYTYDLMNRKWSDNKTPVLYPLDYNPNKEFEKERNTAFKAIQLYNNFIEDIVLNVKELGKLDRYLAVFDNLQLVELKKNLVKVLKDDLKKLQTWDQKLDLFKTRSYKLPEKELYFPYLNKNKNWEAHNIIYKYIDFYGYSRLQDLLEERLKLVGLSRYMDLLK